MLGWFAGAPNPDHGLLAFRQVSEVLGTTPWYLRALRDEGAMAERLARILASSRYAVELLKRAPQTVQMLADDQELRPRSLAELKAEMHAAARRQSTSVAAVEAIRAIRRRELFRSLRVIFWARTTF
jgi:glutamate-ammonia-ligase adenylyltransferase